MAGDDDKPFGLDYAADALPPITDTERERDVGPGGAGEPPMIDIGEAFGGLRRIFSGE